MTRLIVPNDAMINRLTATLGLLLQLSPWALGFATVEAAAWTAGIGGITVTVMSFAAFIYLREWKEWVCLMTGLFLIVSPWLLGFARNASATWVHVTIGLVVTVLASIELRRLHGLPPNKPA
ncbi:hypothetical protein BB934_01930 [Microvirga ossetica]|uniref:SPW repeat-containing integral membrane domain-containing protein n=1 Tax=Microvirga ossetica TaxID=1882682 RepID=A0A1B2EAX4_9HYPH|nr:SPW repeat protein [Microvirga ossetica]ANY77130.1 hypothetical protein BB934_01930 [Microvirga ossetica]